MQDFEQRWAQPGVAIEVDMDSGAPQPVQPTPLPSTLYQNEQVAKTDIDHALGLYELMQGNSEAAPHTYKATVSLDEFGQRKIKSKLQDIEQSLVRIAKVAIPLMQQLYQAEKIIRIVQPNNSMTEIAINKKLYDDKTGEISVMNDISRGSFDVVVVTGSTLPTNRYAQLEMYMDAYKNGIIDKREVLKKTEVFDMEGVLERTDQVGQMEGQLKQQEEKIKELKGDLQTRERENYHLKQRAELEKFKGELDKVSTQSKSSGKLFEKRLDDVLGQAKSGVREMNKEAEKQKSTPDSKKSAGK
jgi:regulator of replication initiation timing